MKTTKLCAGIGAALLTLLTIGVVGANYTLVTPAPNEQVNGIEVTNLPLVNVSPTPAERRAASLLAVNDIELTPHLISKVDTSSSKSLRSLNAHLVMPYYSFGNQLGRSSKE